MLLMRFPFRIEPILIALALLNLGILGVVALREEAVAVAASVSDGVLRGRGLEIVDGHGNVRASIAIHPAEDQSDGSVYPETVLLRLITPQGRPAVKISTSEDGSAMALSAAEGLAYVQIVSSRRNPKVVIVDGAGRQISTLP
jgi:hypothetical protein